MNFLMPHLSLITGGAASGKSAFAETHVRRFDRPKIYIATMQPFDGEMTTKAQKHQADRGTDWITIEEPLAVADVLKGRDAGEVVLLDCVTLWLTNVILGEHDVDRFCSDLITALVACPASVVVVSNEVGSGIVPDNALSRQFRNAQGRLNQQIAARADFVATVIAGLPMTLKGSAG